MSLFIRALCGTAVAAVLLLVATAQPFLHIGRLGTNLVVTWSGTNSTNFALQEARWLPASNWFPVAQVPASNAGNYSVSIAPTNPAGFFRLFLAASNIVDDPDDNYVDSNGDGIDGDISRATFVAATGNDSDPGTMNQPVRTVAEGIRRAAARGKHVYVAGGIYNSGTVWLTNGVSVYGGYQPGDWSVRHLSHSPELVVSNSIGVIAAALVTTTHVDHVRIRIHDQTNASVSVYGIIATNSSGLILNQCEIHAGNGGPGTDGMDGTNGLDGVVGQAGQPGCENSNFVCDSCDRPQGGPGGPSPCGQIGGIGGLPGLGGGVGLPGGLGAGGTQGGSGGPGGGGGHGMPGDPGAQGAPGTNGTAGSGNYNIAGYSPASADSGSPGQPGNGGGGGGGGGGGDDDCDSYGSAGGGGGGGACGGSPGTGGKSGGGSFAVYAWSSTISIHNCALIAGDGGNGGRGGIGGSGGVGGPGGSGGPYGGSSEQDDGGNGAMGGRGGDGGRGGHGGGGAGGPSICVVRTGGSIVNLTASTLVTSSGGRGGASSGNPGPTGIAVPVLNP